MWFMGERETKEAFAVDKLTMMGTLVHTWDITPEFVEAIYGAVTGTTGLLISNSINHSDDIDNALGTAGTLSSVAQGGALADAVESGTTVAELSDAGAGSVASGIGNALTAISMLKLMWDQKKRDNQK